MYQKALMDPKGPEAAEVRRIDGQLSIPLKTVVAANPWDPGLINSVFGERSSLAEAQTKNGVVGVVVTPDETICYAKRV